MIRGFEDECRFIDHLNANLSPAEPVRTIERLFGRKDEVTKVLRALAVSGRHVFIFGDRGVGKSSLAASTAAQFQSADAEYIDVSCSPDATFLSVVVNIANQALRQPSAVKTVKRSTKSLNLRFLQLAVEKEESQRDLRAQVTNVVDAVDLLREVAAIHSQNPVVVVDEFDRMEPASERSLFADLLKHLGDKGIALKFVFTGIGATLDELLGAHQSSIRQLETVELPRLSWEGRLDILEHAFSAFAVDISDEWRFRIASMTDGYPYYVHLIAEKILWCLSDVNHYTDCVVEDHYRIGLNNAIGGVSAELKKPYDTAIQSSSDDYEEILWATAAREFLISTVGEMYEQYLEIMKQIPDRTPLDREKFRARVRKLKEQRFGNVLESVGSSQMGRYRYRENMLRGYVRMQAEANGVRLVGTSDAQGVMAPVQHVKLSSNRTGYDSSRVPKGVRLRGERK